MSTSGQILRGVGHYIPQRAYEMQREKNHIVKISNALDSKSEILVKCAKPVPTFDKLRNGGFVFLVANQLLSNQLHFHP